MALLSPHELFSADFISFLVHRNPELRKPVSSWLEKAGRGIPEQQLEQRLELFLACGPPHVLKEAQEDFIRQVGEVHHRHDILSFDDGYAAPPSARHVTDSCN